MKQMLLFILILIEATILRFFYLTRVPPLIETSDMGMRTISASLNLGTAIAIFLYVKMMFKSRKYAYLSMFFFANLPWTIEQGRIVSEVNNFLFLFLLTFLISKKFKNYILKASLCFFLLLNSFLVYPSFWLFKINQYVFTVKDFINNVFLLISPTFLFFKNPTFWWGGVRDVGVMPFTFIPILILGFYHFILSSKLEIKIASLVILFISAASPFLPESREYFLITPIISLILALGVNSLFIKKSFFAQVVFYFLFILIIYDLSQFLHYYFIHYPQQIISNIDQIHGAF